VDTVWKLLCYSEDHISCPPLEDNKAPFQATPLASPTCLQSLQFVDCIPDAERGLHKVTLWFSKRCSGGRQLASSDSRKNVKRMEDDKLFLESLVDFMVLGW